MILNMSSRKIGEQASPSATAKKYKNYVEMVLDPDWQPPRWSQRIDARAHKDQNRQHIVSRKNGEIMEFWCCHIAVDTGDFYEVGPFTKRKHAIAFAASVN